jgi:flagellar FliJ protein
MSSKTLKTLVRLNEWEVDERQRRLGELLRLVESLEKQIEALRAELAHEQQVAIASPDQAAFLFGNYVFTVIARRNWINDSIAKAEVEVEGAREQLRDAYRDLKKFEILKESGEKRENAELERKERIDLDEVGLQSFRERSKKGN